MNHYIAIGRLTGAAELKYTQGGQPFIKFSICINKRWKDKNGEKQEKANYFNCVLWGKYGELMHPYLTKGKQVAIFAELDQNTWTDSNGNNHSQVQLVVNEIELLQSPRGENNNGGKEEPPPAPSKNGEPGDIPF